MNHEELLDKTKLHLFLDTQAVFINSIFFGLNFEWKEDIPTAQTDGKTIFTNPTWFSELNDKQRVGLMLHEAWHVALEHPTRIGNRCPKYWAKACDYLINLMLVKDGYEIPDGGCIDYKFDGWEEERIYDYIWENEPEPPPGDIIFPDGSNETEELSQSIKDTILNAVIQHTTAQQNNSSDIGDIPGGIARRLEEWLNPQLPWHVILQNYMNDFVNDEYTWSVPDRRYLPLDIIMPSLHGYGMNIIHFYMDTSGSITEETLNTYLVEAGSSINVVDPEKIFISSFDTQLYEPIEISNVSSLGSLSFEGGGGTKITPVMEHIHKSKNDVSIIFTDGDFNAYVPENFNKNVIWVIDGNSKFTSEVGLVVHIN